MADKDKLEALETALHAEQLERQSALEKRFGQRAMLAGRDISDVTLEREGAVRSLFNKTVKLMRPNITDNQRIRLAAEVAEQAADMPPEIVERVAELLETNSPALSRQKLMPASFGTGTVEDVADMFIEAHRFDEEAMEMPFSKRGKKLVNEFFEFKKAARKGPKAAKAFKFSDDAKFAITNLKRITELGRRSAIVSDALGRAQRIGLPKMLEGLFKGALVPPGLEDIAQQFIDFQRRRRSGELTEEEQALLLRALGGT